MSRSSLSRCGRVGGCVRSVSRANACSSGISSSTAASMGASGPAPVSAAFCSAASLADQPPCRSAIASIEVTRAAVGSTASSASASRPSPRAAASSAPFSPPPPPPSPGNLAGKLSPAAWPSRLSRLAGASRSEASAAYAFPHSRTVERPSRGGSASSVLPSSDGAVARKSSLRAPGSAFLTRGSMKSSKRKVEKPPVSLNFGTQAKRPAYSSS